MKKICKIHKKETGSSKSVKSPLLASLHSIVICALVLVSFCFAWFTQTIQKPVTIQAATYGITAEVSGNGNNTAYSTVTSGDYIALEVENGKLYDICLKTTETTSASEGYCVVSAGDDIYYTVPISQENRNGVSFQIFFRGTGSSKVDLLPYWGVYPNTIPEGSVIPAADDVISSNGKYVVSDGDILVSPGDSK